MTHFAAGGKSTIRPEEMTLAGRVSVVLTGVNLPRPANNRTPADVDLDFETHQLSVPDGTQLEAWYVAHPDQRGLVLLFHGYGGSKSRLLDEARAFHEVGCGVLLVDFRGSGGSSGNSTTLGVYESDDVLAAFALGKKLAEGRPLILYGRSMGSVAILRAIALDGIAPAGIIIECPFDRLLTTVKNRFRAIGLPSFPCAELLVFWGSVQHAMNGFAHNPEDYARQVHCPVLLLHGELDKRVSVAEVRAVFENLAGEKQFHLFTEVGHESCHRTRPDLWEQFVFQFLDEHAAWETK
jgi:alpha-beta hydrolase superfamily lysophospholipase